MKYEGNRLITKNTSAILEQTIEKPPVVYLMISYLHLPDYF